MSSGFDDLRTESRFDYQRRKSTSTLVGPGQLPAAEDAINENARRLAAIMRDGIGNQDWLEEFKTEVPALWEEVVDER